MQRRDAEFLFRLATPKIPHMQSALENKVLRPDPRNMTPRVKGLYELLFPDRAERCDVARGESGGTGAAH